MADFAFTSQRKGAVRDVLGSGQRLVVTGTAGSLEKTVSVATYRDHPGMAFFEVKYTNKGSADLTVESWTNHHYRIQAPAESREPAFWSFQSGSYRNRPDWVLPLKPAFQQDNYLGMNATDYGGGTPVVDVWHRQGGIGAGHIELAPKLVSLPVTSSDAQSATVAVEYKHSQTLKPGATLTTFRTFVSVHQGDYFETLGRYRRVMEKQGVAFPPAPESAFGPLWCAWGYGRGFTPSQIYGALPMVKKLGFSWVTVDYGWQPLEGDGKLDATKFPQGDLDMRALVNRIHDEGFRAQLWWAPLLTQPETDVVKARPELLLLNADGSRQRISFWNGWYLCPAHPEVVRHFRDQVRKILGDWGYDGLKLDGMHMNAAPPCYNPEHKHARPEESVEAVPQFFRMIFETARSIKRDALIEYCPCGTSFSFFTLPYMNMSVASDPSSSFQIRSKGKTLKALHGDSIAYFGDHVELSSGRDDFASTIGVGGVVGTNFTWPPGSAQRDRVDLTPAKEAHFAKWIGLYNEKMLSRGEYLGALYDIGFDKPEGHAIRKGGRMYYAFFAPEWKGRIELRGLGNRRYRVTDYANGKSLGSVRGPAAAIEVEFQQHVLLEAVPE